MKIAVVEDKMTPLETGLLLALLGLYGKIIFDVLRNRRNNKNNKENPGHIEALAARVQALEQEISWIRPRLHEFGNQIATLLERTRRIE